jgi:hypothetical protein
MLVPTGKVVTSPVPTPDPAPRGQGKFFGERSSGSGAMEGHYKVASHCWWEAKGRRGRLGCGTQCPETVRLGGVCLRACSDDGVGSEVRFDVDSWLARSGPRRKQATSPSLQFPPGPLEFHSSMPDWLREVCSSSPYQLADWSRMRTTLPPYRKMRWSIWWRFRCGGSRPVEVSCLPGRDKGGIAIKSPV